MLLPWGIILAICGEESALIHAIIKRQRIWIEDTRRGDSLLRSWPLRTAFHGTMVGKKTRGRRRQMMLDWMMTDFYVLRYSFVLVDTNFGCMIQDNSCCCYVLLSIDIQYAAVSFL